VTVDRRLLHVVERRQLRGAAALLEFLPASIVDPFDTAELAATAGMARRTAQQLVYCLREGGVLTPVGKAGNAILYARPAATD
jgi:hypothetical protein